MQVVVADQFETRRYDLQKVTMLCNPVAKSGAPIALVGPTKGQPFPIDPATVRHATAHLVCYQVKPAKTVIAQNRCVPANADDKGTKITQPKHVPRLGVHIANQFGRRDGRYEERSRALHPVGGVDGAVGGSPAARPGRRREDAVATKL